MDKFELILDPKALRAIKRMDMAQLNAYLFRVRLQGYEKGFSDGLKTREAIKIKEIVPSMGAERS